MILLEKVTRAIGGEDSEGYLIPNKIVEARAAITVVLEEMYAGRSLDLAGGDYTKRWRDTVLSFASREGIDLDGK